MKNPWIIIGVLVVALVGGSVWYSNTVTEQANEGVEVMAHIKGNPDADVVLIKYSDFQCPACAAFAPAVDEVLAEFGDDVRFEYRHFPLIQIHPFAVQAARAAEAAGQQGEFFAYHDALFNNQATWSQTPNPTTYFVQFAEELGLDMDEFTRHQRSSILQDKVMDGYKEAQEQGFTGTPTFTLNGERMQYGTYEEFRDQIAAAVAGDNGASVQFGNTVPNAALSEVETDVTTESTPAPAAAGEVEVEATPTVEFGI